MNHVGFVDSHLELVVLSGRSALLLGAADAVLLLEPLVHVVQQVEDGLASPSSFHAKKKTK